MSIFDAFTADSEQHGRETRHLQAEVPAGTTNWTDAVTWTVPNDGTVTEVRVWHVPNSADDLRTKPVLDSSEGQFSRQNLPDYGDDGEEFITGEPDDRPYRSDQQVESDDEIVVEAQNQNSNYAYRFTVLVTVDYAGGTDRVFGPSGGAR